MLRMGTAKKEINPPLNVPHAGWGAQTHVFAKGIESDFYTTVMVLADGAVRTVLIDVDTPQFTIEQTQEIRNAVADALGVAALHIRLAVTHSHAGPMLWSSYYADGKDAVSAYLSLIVERTTSAALEAADNMVEVSASAGFGSCSVGVNRRQRLASGRVVVGANPDGITDPAVGVVRFADEHNRTVATIVQYACHPTTLGFTYDLHSPDYPGELKRFVERNTGGICLFLQGCAGNVGPGHEGFLDNVAATHRIGAAIGAEAVKTALELEARSYGHTFQGVVESGAPLGIWHSELQPQQRSLQVMSANIPVPLKKLAPVEQARDTYNRCERQLADLQSGGASAEEIKEATYKVKRAYIALHSSEKYEGQTEALIETHFTRIGDTVLVGAQVELFAEIGLQLKRLSPFAVTLVGGYSNGVMGYMPVAEAYAEGGYEVDTSPYAPEAAEKYVIGVERILRQLAQ